MMSVKALILLCLVLLVDIQAQVGEAPEETTTTGATTSRVTTTSSDVGEAPEETSSNPSTSILSTTTIPTTTGDSSCSSQLGVKWVEDYQIDEDLQVATETECCDACKQTLQCVSWSYQVIGQPICLLFSQANPVILPPSEAISWVSGVVGNAHLAGLRCADGKVLNQQGQVVEGQECSCSEAGSNCLTCRADRPSTCLQCTNSKYLNDGQCYDECPSTMVPVGDSDIDRTCRQPYDCINGRDQDGNSCPSCSKSLSGCIDCRVLAGKDNVVCLKCEDNRYAVAGKCPRFGKCRRGQVLDSDVGEECECPDIPNCHTCQVSKIKQDWKVCLTCRDNTLLQDDVCVSKCPDNLATVRKGSSAFGGECQQPFTCQNDKIKFDPDRYGDPCRCSDANCRRCRFTASGEICDSCKNYHFLHDGQCIESCPSSTVSYGNGKRNRQCLSTGFECIKEKSSIDQSACTCPDNNCLECVFEIGNIDGTDATCKKCLNSYLHQGKCLSTCPVGFKNAGKGKRGRYCEAEN